MRKVTGGFQIVAGVLFLGASGTCAAMVLPEIHRNDLANNFLIFGILGLVGFIGLFGIFQGWRNMTMSDAEDAARAERRKKTQDWRLASAGLGVIGALLLFSYPGPALFLITISIVLALVAVIKEWRQA
jgi:hypothetical protein